MDYWALGVLAFEMVDGKTPFFAERPMALYEKILEGKYKMPLIAPGIWRTSFIVVAAEPGKRLGNGKGGRGDQRPPLLRGYTYVSARVPIKIENNEDSDESDVESFVEDEEEKGTTCSGAVGLDAGVGRGAEIRL